MYEIKNYELLFQNLLKFNVFENDCMCILNVMYVCVLIFVDGSEKYTKCLVSYSLS